MLSSSDKYHAYHDDDDDYDDNNIIITVRKTIEVCLSCGLNDMTVTEESRM
jgi:hypothetical protein